MKTQNSIRRMFLQIISSRFTVSVINYDLSLRVCAHMQKWCICWLVSCKREKINCQVCLKPLSVSTPVTAKPVAEFICSFSLHMNRPCLILLLVWSLLYADNQLSELYGTHVQTHTVHKGFKLKKHSYITYLYIEFNYFHKLLFVNVAVVNTLFFKHKKMVWVKCQLYCVLFPGKICTVIWSFSC